LKTGSTCRFGALFAYGNGPKRKGSLLKSDRNLFKQRLDREANYRSRPALCFMNCKGDIQHVQIIDGIIYANKSTDGRLLSGGLLGANRLQDPPCDSTSKMDCCRRMGAKNNFVSASTVTAPTRKTNVQRERTGRGGNP
jgi:hypothetical protein